MGAVGSCMFSNCDKSRGPTYCAHGTCYCQQGYCRYPASTLHIQSRYCVARIPGATCHMSRFCWSGGLSTSFCESGLCMCKFGRHPVSAGNGKYTCDESSDMIADIANDATQEKIENLLAFQSESDLLTTYNLLTAALWVAVAVALTIGLLLVVLKKSFKKIGKERGVWAAIGLNPLQCE